MHCCILWQLYFVRTCQSSYEMGQYKFAAVVTMNVILLFLSGLILDEKCLTLDKLCNIFCAYTHARTHTHTHTHV